MLEAWAKAEGWTRLAEIGVKRGENMFYLLERCLGLTVIGVDIWSEYFAYKDPGLSGRPGHLIGAATATEWERVVRAGAEKFGSRAVIIKVRSLDAAGLVGDASLDCVFIDANHTEEDVCAEIIAWRPKVRRGGMLSGHDLHLPSVRRAVEASVRGWKEYPGHVWGVRV